MFDSINKTILVGNVGNEPETRTFADGGMITRFSVATNSSWKDKDSGERKSRTEWHNVEVRSKGLAKLAAEWVRKGSNVYIEGESRTEKFTDREGIERYATKVHVGAYGGTVRLLDSKADVEARDRQDMAA